MNGTSKNVGIGKCWQDLEISEAFLISLEVSFLHGLFLPFFESRNFLPKGLGLGFLTRISASRRVSDFTIRHPLTLSTRQIEAWYGCYRNAHVSGLRLGTKFATDRSYIIAISILSLRFLISFHKSSSIQNFCFQL